MNCWSVSRRSTDYVDGRLRQSEHSRVEAHLLECEECEARIREIRSLRSALRKLPAPRIPGDLRTRLRISASLERQSLLETDGSQLRRAWNNWKFRVNQMMRPLTIPATGGLLSSLILFGALAFTIGTTTRGVTYEVPVVYANRADPNLVPVELRSSVVLTLSLDGNGRITDYAVRDGSGSFVGDSSRLQGDNISLPEFPGVLAMAQPTTRDISISFIPIVFQR
ncbi:MAG TPA: zf-HC2 domain-containing protein [Bryobacteraceae bacterium]|jgi:hypothetical protein